MVVAVGEVMEYVRRDERVLKRNPVVLVFFLSATFFFFVLVMRVLKAVGMLGDVGSYLLGGLVFFACELVVANLLRVFGNR